MQAGRRLRLPALRVILQAWPWGLLLLALVAVRLSKATTGRNQIAHAALNILEKDILAFLAEEATMRAYGPSDASTATITAVIAVSSRTTAPSESRDPINALNTYSDGNVITSVRANSAGTFTADATTCG